MRVNAPLTDYHDLRAVVASSRGVRAADAVRWWPSPHTTAVRAVAAESLDELRRRERALNIRTSDLLTGPGALWTMTHPSNETLTAVARQLLAVLDLDGSTAAPPVEFLGQRRSPVDIAVAEALGWPLESVRPDWVIDGVVVPLIDVLTQQLRFYASRPDVVARTLARESKRLAALDLCT